MGNARYGGDPVFSALTHHGNLGVDFFFVLSGFIIMNAHEKDINSPSRWTSYIIRRFIRVYPIYWVYTITLMALVFLGFGNHVKMPNSLSNFITALTLIRFDGSSTLIEPAWTLFHEVYFYSIFSLLILNKKLGLIVIFLLILIFGLFQIHLSKDPLNVYFSFINLEFFIGMMAYLIFKKSTKGTLPLILGLISSLTLYFFFVETPKSQLLFSASFGLCIAGLSKLETRGLLTVPGSISFLGGATYSIYLTHIAFEGLILKLLIKLDCYNLFGKEFVYILTLLISLSLGLIAFLSVEKRLLNILKSRLRIYHS